jgi:hypothetical protein
MLTTLCNPAIAICVIEQRRKIRISANENVAAATTVTAVRATHWNAMLTTKRRASRSTGARFDVNFYSINEHSRARQLL